MGDILWIGSYITWCSHFTLSNSDSLLVKRKNVGNCSLEFDTCMHACIHAHTYICSHTHTHTHTHTHMHMWGMKRKLNFLQIALKWNRQNSFGEWKWLTRTFSQFFWELYPNDDTRQVVSVYMCGLGEFTSKDANDHAVFCKVYVHVRRHECSCCLLWVGEQVSQHLFSCVLLWSLCTFGRHKYPVIMLFCCWWKILTCFD